MRKQEEVTLSTEGGGSGKAAAVMKLSATEAQLLELQRKREALLGRTEEVERLTEVSAASVYWSEAMYRLPYNTVCTFPFRWCSPSLKAAVAVLAVQTVRWTS